MASLRAIGLRDVRGWARLDPAAVAGRYGPEGVRLHKIARGYAASRLPWDPPDPGPVAERVVLGAPTLTLEPLLFVLPGLLARMADTLAARDLMAVKVALHLVLECSTSTVLRLRVGRPTRDPAVLLRGLRARLERTRLDAPVVELLLEVEEETREVPWQPGLLDRSEATEDLGDLLGRLSEHLGDGAVFGAVPVDGWRPEEAWRNRAFVPGQPFPVPVPHKKADEDPVAEQRAWEQEGPRPRPLLLLERPERVEVQAEAGGPARLRLEGRWCAVDQREGPERLEGGWWREDGGYYRDCWVVQVEGSTAWIFQDDQARWYLHGWFD
jgi:protein ImuB